MVERGVEKKNSSVVLVLHLSALFFIVFCFSLFIIVLSQASKRVLHMRGW